MDEHLGGYSPTAHRHDETIATLQEILARPELTDDDVRTLAEITQSAQRPRSYRLLPGAKHRHRQALRAAASERLGELLSDRPIIDLSLPIGELRRSIRLQIESLTNELRFVRGATWTVPHLIETINNILLAAPATRQRIGEEWQRLSDHWLTPLLSELKLGLVSRDDIFEAVTAGLAVPLRASVAEALKPAERSVGGMYTEASVRGFVFDPRDARSLALFEEVTARVRARVHLPPSTAGLITRIEDTAVWRQSDFETFTDEAATLYLHFTPKIREIAEDGMLRSGAHDDIPYTTNSRGSFGVHFIKPGAWNGTEEFGPYMRYANALRYYADKSSSHGSLGAIIVMPLEAIVAVTPWRCEFKTTDDNDGHLASDAVFRPLDETDLYAYPLDKAYIVPCYGSWQVSWEDMVTTDPESGDVSFKPVSEPIREVFRQAGYDESWIQRHVMIYRNRFPTMTSNTVVLES
ncbi:hypothetical protein ACRS6B_13900 [Nocardia asteroides]